MLACVFWNHVNNLYTNTLYTVYIYNHTSHVGWWRKIFFLQCLYSKLLFLHRAQWPGPQRSSATSEFGVRCVDKHTALPDTRLPPYTRSLSSVCLHMWRTANLLTAFCFSFSPSLYCLSERFPPELPVSHNAPWPLSGCARGKKVLGCKGSLVRFTLQSPYIFQPPLCFPDLVVSAPIRWSSTFSPVVYMLTKLNFLKIAHCSVKSTWGLKHC